MDMEMGLGGLTGISNIADMLSDGNLIARGHRYASLPKMGEQDCIIIALNQNMIAF